MAAGLSKEIPITEYSPKKIKMSITGNGNASKEQVAKMLQSLLNIKELPKNLDSTDGLAAAVCHFYNSKSSLNPPQKTIQVGQLLLKIITRGLKNNFVRYILTYSVL